MGKVLEKIFGRSLSLAEARAFFNSKGVPFTGEGFPNINDVGRVPLDAYNVWFKRVKTRTVESGGEQRTDARGIYCTRAQASFKDSSGVWRPGGVSRYKFRIEDGQPKIKRKIDWDRVLYPF